MHSPLEVHLNLFGFDSHFDPLAELVVNGVLVEAIVVVVMDVVKVAAVVADVVFAVVVKMFVVVFVDEVVVLEVMAVVVFAGLT